MFARKHLLFLLHAVICGLHVVAGLALPAAGEQSDFVSHNENLERLAQLEPRAPFAGGIPLRIMPLGASITFGVASSDGNGYRKTLRDGIVAQGNQVNFVGSHPNGTMEDNENEGWPGYVITQIHDKSRAFVPQCQPNVFLVNAGTNDCIQDIDIPETSIRIASMMEDMYKQSPRATVILSTLLPNAQQATEQRVETVNNQYRKLVMDLQLRGKRIVLAEMRGSNGVVIGDIGPDGVHPNDTGYKKMSAIWLDAISRAAAKGYLRRPEDNGLPDNGATA
ncbi:SGNH hydrolase-type esterase domain-containing protein [Pseudomassariella vexata]|uniref:SGNH hydrolase-type esterase domain-containing protein n=1 Tax=Pseudomassariella vexata TaxID=1141098 RepID=A0A1Y2DK16_9PEZI|nr:SGNH hydrolase-type esterase domain-containing protein [Pseudomassariella vexata]ORY59592.1 SGNH hydrolase-type esterase domain-containing protein [Pseudomassariella vexata]